MTAKFTWSARLFDFDDQFNWNMCATFSVGRVGYRPPGDGLVLFHIDEQDLPSRREARAWITDGSMIDTCHAMRHQPGEKRLEVGFENIRGEQLPPFVLDPRRFFPARSAAKPLCPSCPRSASCRQRGYNSRPCPPGTELLAAGATSSRPSS